MRSTFFLAALVSYASLVLAGPLEQRGMLLVAVLLIVVILIDL
jgi:hypothetical protein